jgi:hypothetical protein
VNKGCVEAAGASGERNDVGTDSFMRSIQHLPPDEQQHYILCDCSEYIDMRDLGQVFSHLHADLPQPEWSHSVKVGEPIAYSKESKRMDLN